MTYIVSGGALYSTHSLTVDVVISSLVVVVAVILSLTIRSFTAAETRVNRYESLTKIHRRHQSDWNWRSSCSRSRSKPLPSSKCDVLHFLLAASRLLISNMTCSSEWLVAKQFRHVDVWHMSAIQLFIILSLVYSNTIFRSRYSTQIYYYIWKGMDIRWIEHRTAARNHGLASSSLQAVV